MCNNRSYSREEAERYRRLGELAARVLQGESMESIAKSEDKPVEDVEAEFRAIKPINPYLYKQIFGED